MQSYQVQVKMDFNILHILVLCALQLYTECAFGRGTTAGCSGIPSTNNRPRTCAVNHTTTQGSSIYMDCKASHKHVREALWLKMNQNNHSCFGPVLGELKDTVIHDNFTLELRDLSRGDDGTYLCIYWDNIVASYCLSVIAIPTLKVTVNGGEEAGVMSAILGQSYVLQCAAFGADPPINLTWSYNKQMFNKDESNPSVNVGNASNVSTSLLGLVPIRAGSSNVTCVSNGRYQEQDIMSTLQVEIYAIPIMRVTVKGAAPSGTMFAILGRKYVVQCAAFGADPPVNLTWSYNKQMYNKDESNPSVNVVGNTSNVCSTSLELIPIRTGSSNVTCVSNDRYQEQDILSTLKVEIYAIPNLFVTVNDEKPNGTLSAVVHRKYDLKCIAVGAYPTVNLTWIPDNEDFFVKEYNYSSFIQKDQTFDSVISFRYTFNQTGSSNITCSSNGMYSSQNLNHTLHVQVNAQPVFTNWIFWFGLAVFILSTITIGLLLRHKAGKYNTTKENNIYYRGIRLSSKLSTFESLRKRESGSIPLIEIKQKDCNYGVDTIGSVMREDVSVMTLIPSKSFLKYFKGRYSRSGICGHVLVKTVKEYAYVKDIYTFVKYSKLMESLPKHENVVALLGISDKEMPIYSYHEYVECLTLRNYMLRNDQWSGLSASSTFTRNSSDSRDNNVTIELYEFAEDVASGMCFLISQNFKHPALSLRKVLLSNSGQCKLYDIWPEAMSSDRIRYLLQRKDPPLAWMAPECIFLGQYHLNTDVWSYGVFMWELFSFGETPFKNMSTFEIEKEVRKSRNLPMPPNCPGAIFSLMLSSWNKDADKRPHFENILKQLSCILQSIQHENNDQREVDVMQERNSQYHKYFTLESQPTDR